MRDFDRFIDFLDFFFVFSSSDIIRKFSHQSCSGEFELDEDIHLMMAPVLKAGEVIEVSALTMYNVAFILCGF